MVYHQLTNLIRDTVWLKSYLSAVLRVEAEAFQAANIALGSMKAALPANSESLNTAAVTSSLDVEADAIPAARLDGMPVPQASVVNRMNNKGIRLGSQAPPHNESVGITNMTKDSLYTLDDGMPHVPTHRVTVSGGAGMQQQGGATTQGGYDRYGVADSSAYSRNPVPAW